MAEEQKDDLLKQALLLNAMKVSTDPNKLKQLTGMKKVADVYSTFDRIAMHKEYANTLISAGVDMKFIVDNLKKVIEDSDVGQANKMAAIKLLMSSLGLDKRGPSDGELSSTSWEAELMKIEEEEKNNNEIVKELAPPEYEVDIPDVPDNVKKQKEKDDLIEKSLYE